VRDEAGSTAPGGRRPGWRSRIRGNQARGNQARGSRARRRPSLRGLVAAVLALLPGENKRQTAALLVLGYMTGLVMGVALLSARLDRVSLEREALLVKVADLQVQVEKLQGWLDRLESGGPGPMVSEITFHFRGQDELTRLRVRSALSEFVDDLVGESVVDLDPALVLHLLDDRTVTVEGKTIVLQVWAVVLGSETAFWIDLEAVDKPPPETGE